MSMIEVDEEVSRRYASREDKEAAHMEKLVAQAAYRAAWEQYVTCTDPRRRMDLQVTMDAVQPDCVDSRGPGPEWAAFAATLPGFLDYWGQISNLLDRARAERVR